MTRPYLTSADIQAGKVVTGPTSDAEWDAMNDAVVLYDLTRPALGRNARMAKLRQEK